MTCSDEKLSQAYFVLGSNIDAEQNLPAAVSAILQYGTISNISSVWETEPIGFADQPNFLNVALLLNTGLNISEIRTEMIPQIEQKLLRVRDPNNKNGPRTIDVDLVMYNNLIYKDCSFQLPDPDILTRHFLAGLLAEIAPQFIHPAEQRSLSEIANSLASENNHPLIRKDVDLDELVNAQ